MLPPRKLCLLRPLLGEFQEMRANEGDGGGKSKEATQGTQMYFIDLTNCSFLGARIEPTEGPRTSASSQEAGQATALADRGSRFLCPHMSAAAVTRFRTHYFCFIDKIRILSSFPTTPSNSMTACLFGRLLASTSSIRRLDCVSRCSGR